MAIFETDGVPWKQFTVWGGTDDKCWLSISTKGLLLNFLPAFLKENRHRLIQWHYLFEPGCLVRFASADPEAVFESASRLAASLSQSFLRADLSKAGADDDTGEDYHDETDFYETMERFRLNIAFLQANGELSLSGFEDGVVVGQRRSLLWKVVHLVMNQYGVHQSMDEALILSMIFQARVHMMFDKKDLQASTLFSDLPALEGADHSRRG